MNKRFLEYVSSIKEVLESMPQNNKKNKDKYIEYLKKVLDENVSIKNKLYDEIENRYNNILRDKVKCSDDVSKLVSYRNELEILFSMSTSYELSGLDRVLNDIFHFYKDDFESVNDDINKAIGVFKKVGIDIVDKDFNYSPYVKEYMKIYLAELKNNNLDSSVLRECFDKLYWKCPNIIFQIEINFKYLYYKNKKIFDKYYGDLKRSVIDKYNKDIDSIHENYIKMVNDYQENACGNIYNIIDDFLDRKYNVSDYSKDKIIKLYDDFGTDESNINNLRKLLITLREYKGYLEYQYIIDDIRNKYKEKDKYKDVAKNKLKEIKKREDVIDKLNKKINFQKKFSIYANKIEKITLDINQKIDEVKELYKELEQDKFNEAVASLEDNTSLYDCLILASSYYSYLRELLRDKFEDISEEEIEKKQDDLKKYLFDTCINIINNISIVQDVDVALIIKDRYKLLNISVDHDNILQNVDGIIGNIERIVRYYNIDISKIKYEELKFLSDAKDILKV